MKDVLKETTDYSIFKYIEENREVDKNTSKYRALKANIKKKGYLICNITVNKDGYIVNGQHRVAACKELGIPVSYVINHKVTVEDIMDANDFEKSWALRDYAHNKAVQGDADCKKLLELFDEYNDFGEAAVADAFNANTTKGANASIKTDLYSISPMGYTILDNCRELDDVIGKQSKQAKLVRAMKTIVKNNDHFNIEVFKSKCNMKKLHIYQNERDIAVEIVEIYNYYNHGKQISI